MTGKLKFILVQLLSWLGFFELARMIFLLYHPSQTSQLPLKTLFLSFVFGSRMDLSMACYVLILPALLVLLSVLVPFFRRPLPYKIYSGVVLFLLLAIVLVDLEIYNEWGYRLDSTILQYLSSPKEAMASAGHLPVFWILLVFVLVFAVLLFLFNRIIDRTVFLLQSGREMKLVSVATIAALIALLIIPMRGGVQMQPMNPSWVYFSTNNYANVSALNAPWNFFQDLLDKERGIKNPYLFLNRDESKAAVDSLFSASGAHRQIVDTSAGKPNVILIVWESFTKKAVDTLIGGQEITPNINRLKKEGIYFDHVFASGDRTHKGMSAIFSGYPALPNTSIIRFPQKSAKLTLVSNIFQQHGYSTTFFYGGDPDYDNYKSFWLHGGFRIVGETAFNPKDRITEWGVTDGAVASYMANDFKNWTPPFFTSWLTLTSHVPYRIPIPPLLRGNSESVLFLNSLHYTDEVIGRFVEECSKQPWWGNTLLIITADHGIRFPATGKTVNDFTIPMLWLGGAVEKNKGLVIHRLASQTDLSATLLKQMGWSPSAFPFSRDITDSTAIPFAFFSNSVSFGLVQPGGYYIYDVKGRGVREEAGQVNEKDIRAGKALQQVIYEDYLKK